MRRHCATALGLVACIGISSAVWATPILYEFGGSFIGTIGVPAGWGILNARTFELRFLAHPENPWINAEHTAAFYDWTSLELRCYDKDHHEVYSASGVGGNPVFVANNSGSPASDWFALFDGPDFTGMAPNISGAPAEGWTLTNMWLPLVDHTAEALNGLGLPGVDLTKFGHGPELPFLGIKFERDTSQAEAFFSVTSASPSAVPEPASCALLALALGGVGAMLKRRRER